MANNSGHRIRTQITLFKKFLKRIVHFQLYSSYPLVDSDSGFVLMVGIVRS